LCGGAGCDGFAVWFGNEVALYLWRRWRAVLVRYGINWQSFLAILSGHTEGIVKWALRDELGWVELVGMIIRDLSNKARGGGITEYL